MRRRKLAPKYEFALTNVQQRNGAPPSLLAKRGIVGVCQKPQPLKPLSHSPVLAIASPPFARSQSVSAQVDVSGEDCNEAKKGFAPIINFAHCENKWIASPSQSPSLAPARVTWPL